MLSLKLTKEDSRDVFPHDNDSIVIFVIMKIRKVHRVLVDQGSSADILFWDAFVSLGIPFEKLEQFDGILVGFTDDLVQVRGYLSTQMAFGEGDTTKTIDFRYMVVNVLSSFNILLGHSAINKLGAVVSSVHMKIKYPSDNGQVGVIRLNRREARKCYEASLKGRRRCMYIE